MDTEQPMLLALGTDSPMPDFLTDWLSQETTPEKRTARRNAGRVYPRPRGAYGRHHGATW